MVTCRNPHASLAPEMVTMRPPQPGLMCARRYWGVKELGGGVMGAQPLKVTVVATSTDLQRDNRQYQHDEHDGMILEDPADNLRQNSPRLVRNSVRYACLREASRTWCICMLR